MNNRLRGIISGIIIGLSLGIICSRVNSNSNVIAATQSTSPRVWSRTQNCTGATIAWNPITIDPVAGTQFWSNPAAICIKNNGATDIYVSWSQIAPITAADNANLIVLNAGEDKCFNLGTNNLQLVPSAANGAFNLQCITTGGTNSVKVIAMAGS
jgi:hypothetical protein